MCLNGEIPAMDPVIIGQMIGTVIEEKRGSGTETSAFPEW